MEFHNRGMIIITDKEIVYQVLVRRNEKLLEIALVSENKVEMMILYEIIINDLSNKFVNVFNIRTTGKTYIKEKIGYISYGGKYEMNFSNKPYVTIYEEFIVKTIEHFKKCDIWDIKTSNIYFIGTTARIRQLSIVSKVSFYKEIDLAFSYFHKQKPEVKYHDHLKNVMRPQYPNKSFAKEIKPVINRDRHICDNCIERSECPDKGKDPLGCDAYRAGPTTGRNYLNNRGR